MLHLYRKVGEAIFIGDDIKIYIRRIQYGNLVELAIFAPKEIPIYREEVRAKILAAEELNREKGITIKYKKNKLTGVSSSTSPASSTLTTPPSATH